MDDVAMMGRLQRRGDLAGETKTGSAQSLFALDPGRQRLTIDVFHGDEATTTVDRSAAEEPHDTGMTQRRDRLGFVEKARHVLLVLRQVRVQHFDRGPLASFVVDTFENGTHATLADDSDDAVAKDHVIRFGHLVGHHKTRRDLYSLRRLSAVSLSLKNTTARALRKSFQVVWARTAKQVSACSFQSIGAGLPDSGGACYGLAMGSNSTRLCKT